MNIHSSHKTHVSMSASSYDEICELCGATDSAGDAALRRPCPSVPTAEVYDAEYFLRGRASGKSLYEDYRWLPDLTVPMVEAMIDHLGIEKGQTILDFGCSRGYVVKALRLLGHKACGVDVSKWAIDNADEDTKPYLKLISTNYRIEAQWEHWDWVVAKDVLEHVHGVGHTITDLMNASARGLFAVVPLSRFTNGRYVVEDYEKDVTHCQRFNLSGWVDMFLRPGWSVEASYRVPGVKDNYAQYARGNGFIVARRIG